MARRISINIPNPDKLIEVHFTGQWEQLMHGLSIAGDRAIKGYNIGAMDYSNTILNMVREAIDSGGPPGLGSGSWAPLSPKYIRATRKHKPYKLDGQYYNSIGIFQNSKRTWVGFPYNEVYTGKYGHGLTLNQIAIILEYGAQLPKGDIPARPIWKPAYREAGGKEGLSVFLLHSIRSYLSKAFGMAPNQIRLKGRTAYGRRIRKR